MEIELRYIYCRFVFGLLKKEYLSLHYRRELMSPTECRLSEFEIIEQNRNFVTERIVNKDQREQTIQCLEHKYKCGQLPKYSAHYVDKFVPTKQDCPCLRGCTLVDLIRDYNDHQLGLKNSKQFRLTGGT